LIKQIGGICKYVPSEVIIELDPHLGTGDDIQVPDCCPLTYNRKSSGSSTVSYGTSAQSQL